MPLVEIDLLQGRAQAELDAISDVVHDAMVACSTFHSATGFRSSPNVPPGTCALTRTTSWSFGRGQASYLELPREAWR